MIKLNLKVNLELFKIREKRKNKYLFMLMIKKNLFTISCFII